jgi:non-ribosomal peptide synthetase component F
VSEPTADAGLERIYHRSAAAADERTLSDILHATARAYGDALAIDDGSIALTYAELAVSVVAKAAELSAAGIRRGDRVGIRIPSGTVELYVAILTGEGEVAHRRPAGETGVHAGVSRPALDRRRSRPGDRDQLRPAVRGDVVQ